MNFLEFERCSVAAPGRIRNENMCDCCVNIVNIVLVHMVMLCCRTCFKSLVVRLWLMALFRFLYYVMG